MSYQEKCKELEQQLKEANEVISISYHNEHINKDDYIKYVQINSLKYLTKYKVKE